MNETRNNAKKFRRILLKYMMALSLLIIISNPAYAGCAVVECPVGQYCEEGECYTPPRPSSSSSWSGPCQGEFSGDYCATTRLCYFPSMGEICPPEDLGMDCLPLSCDYVSSCGDNIDDGCGGTIDCPCAAAAVACACACEANSFMCGDCTNCGSEWSCCSSAKTWSTISGCTEYEFENYCRGGSCDSRTTGNTRPASDGTECSCDGPNGVCVSGSCKCPEDCYTCQDLGAQCGYAGDNCGSYVDCGTCHPDYACVNNECILCESDSSACSWNCGYVTNNCYQSVYCGDCCTPTKTCTDYPGQCGTNLYNGCSYVLNCANNCGGLSCQDGQCCECSSSTCSNNQLLPCDGCNWGTAQSCDYTETKSPDQCYDQEYVYTTCSNGACTGSWGEKIYKDGESCTYNGKTGTCSDGICIVPGDCGAACAEQGDCASLLICDATSKKCSTQGLEGGQGIACSDVCPCSGTSVCENGECKMPEGGPCTVVEDCAGSFDCLETTDTTKKCKTECTDTDDGLGDYFLQYGTQGTINGYDIIVDDLLNMPDSCYDSKMLIEYSCIGGYARPISFTDDTEQTISQTDTLYLHDCLKMEGKVCMDGACVQCTADCPNDATCTEHSQCTSKYCNPDNNKCGECTANCPNDVDCTKETEVKCNSKYCDDTVNKCKGCTAHEDCASGYCLNELCESCTGDEDCAVRNTIDVDYVCEEGTCTDKPCKFSIGRAYWVNLLGSPITESAIVDKNTNQEYALNMVVEGKDCGGRCVAFTVKKKSGAGFSHTTEKYDLRIMKTFGNVDLVISKPIKLKEHFNQQDSASGEYVFVAETVEQSQCSGIQGITSLKPFGDGVVVYPYRLPVLKSPA